ncbi:MAG: FGGY family carbohydrate kinase [Armatimonadota bacterium]|jgi:L-fuculokinase
MPNDLAIVLDCGATNVTAAAVDTSGEIVRSASRANGPVAHPGGGEGWLIWDPDGLWETICGACAEVCSELPADRLKAVTMTTWGADGAPVRGDGSLTYPPICWQDDRTEGLARGIADHIDPWDAFAETGYQVIPFNTLLRLIWLREHEPAALDEAECWLMMPGLLSQRLCGETSIEPTSAGTMMAMDMGRRDWSEKMLALAQLDGSFFPRWVEPGSVIGNVHDEASAETGLPSGIPVVAAGHDTQFAGVGSGASTSEAILSSGTWEILMLRLERFTASGFAFDEGLIVECDPVPGLWNPQLLMMGSGVLEWLREHMYADVAEREDAYDRMIADAERVPPGSDGVTVLPSFVPETGPTRKHNTHGTILGLGITTDRAQVYRAALEGLCFQLRHALEVLAEATGFSAEGIRAVGGGSRNELWNHIRADVTGLPVSTIRQKEATALGAALFAFVGAGTFASIDEAQQQVVTPQAVIEPSPDGLAAYSDLYAKYRQAAPALAGFYGGESG